MVVENTPLLSPQFWRATVSQKPEKLRQHPSSEGMASMEGGEGYVGVGIARLAVALEKHSDSSASPSHCALQAHGQV